VENVFSFLQIKCTPYLKASNQQSNKNYSIFDTCVNIPHRLALYCRYFAGYLKKNSQSHRFWHSLCFQGKQPTNQLHGSYDLDGISAGSTPESVSST
jgi:hypothetical protein